MVGRGWGRGVMSNFRGETLTSSSLTEKVSSFVESAGRSCIQFNGKNIQKSQKPQAANKKTQKTLETPKTVWLAELNTVRSQ